MSCASIAAARTTKSASFVSARTERDRRLYRDNIGTAGLDRHRNKAMRADTVCALVSLLAFVAGCTSSPPKSNLPGAREPSLSSALRGLQVGYPMDGVSRNAGTYALIKKNGDSWAVVSIASSRSASRQLVDPKSRFAREGELLFLSDDLKYISVEFSALDATGTDDGKDGRFVCFHVDQGKRNTKDFYPNACNSDLTSNVDQLKNTATQVAVAALTLGITALAANTRKSVDPGKVLAAMDSAGVIPRVKQYWYTQDFTAARSAKQLQAFIDRYRDDDPDGLVSKARASLPVQLEKERIESERAAVAAELVAQKKKRDTELAEQARIHRADQLRMRTAQFRQSLQPGAESHCGLVVEVKKPLVKLQTMIGEYWLRIDQVYGAGDHDCRFVNGLYVD